MAKDNKISIGAGFSKDGMGVTLQALFDGMEGLVQSRSVVGEPIEVGGAVMIPLLEISAGLASGALQSNAHNNGAGAMSAKLAPTAILIIQNDRVRLVNVKNQDVLTRIVDMIPEAVDRLKRGTVSKEAQAAAEKTLNDMTDTDGIEIIEAEG